MCVMLRLWKHAFAVQWESNKKKKGSMKQRCFRWEQRIFYSPSFLLSPVEQLLYEIGWQRYFCSLCERTRKVWYVPLQPHTAHRRVRACFRPFVKWLPKSNAFRVPSAEESDVERLMADASEENWGKKAEDTYVLEKRGSFMNGDMPERAYQHKGLVPEARGIEKGTLTQ